MACLRVSSFLTNLLCRRDEPLAHYDRRYFSGIVTDAERTDTQVHMVRAYLSFFRERKLETWIAHGTLLGWWWNGKVAFEQPFEDCDVLTCSSACHGTLISIPRSRMQRCTNSDSNTTRPDTNTNPQTTGSCGHTFSTSARGYGNASMAMDST